MEGIKQKQIMLTERKGQQESFNNEKSEEDMLVSKVILCLIKKNYLLKRIYFKLDPKTLKEFEQIYR